jgi:hypothetical protein
MHQFPASNGHGMENFGDYSNQAMQVPLKPRSFMQKLNSAIPVSNQRFYANAPAFTPQQQMPQIKVEFAPQQAQASPFQRQPSFN